MSTDQTGDAVEQIVMTAVKTRDWKKVLAKFTNLNFLRKSRWLIFVAFFFTLIGFYLGDPAFVVHFVVAASVLARNAMIAVILAFGAGWLANWMWREDYGHILDDIAEKQGDD